MSSAKIYQVFYKPEQRPWLDSAYEHYNNDQGRSPFFENEVIKLLINSYCNKGAEYFGVLSWRFTAKIRLPGNKPMHSQQLFNLMEKHPGYDIYSFFGRHHPHNPFNPATNGHGRALPTIAQLLCDRLRIGLNLSTWKAQHLVFMNYFLARNEVYERYVSDFLIPAMCRMNDPEDRELYNLVWQNSLYLETGITKLERARLQAMYGKPYYPYHAFVCERLFSLWLSINPQYTIKQLL